MGDCSDQCSAKCISVSVIHKSFSLVNNRLHFNAFCLSIQNIFFSKCSVLLCKKGSYSDVISIVIFLPGREGRTGNWLKHQLASVLLVASISQLFLAHLL